MMLKIANFAPAWLAFSVFFVGALATAADPVAEARRKAEIARIKADHARRAAELKTRSTGSHRGLPPVKSTADAPTRDFRGAPVGTATTAAEKRDFRGNAIGQRDSKPESPAFNAASAPSPADALKSFVAIASNATTMDTLLNYLPASEARDLKEEQARYDPRDAAASRQQLKKLNPSITEESLTFLTNSPYQNKLDRLNRIAGKILDVMNVKVEGNKATLKVSTLSDAEINGARYEYGTAEVELIGEGNAWKFFRYNDSSWVYQEQPR